jgi:Methylamine utilisation protein MauE
MTASGVASQTSPYPEVWVRALLISGRVTLGLIFVSAAYARLHFAGEWHLHDYRFYQALTIDSYKMLPLWAVEWFSRILPWLELALGVLLIVGAGLRWSGTAASALLLLFLGMMARGQILGLGPVGDGFADNHRILPTTLIRDSSLHVLALAVTIGAFLIRRRRATVSS